MNQIKLYRKHGAWWGLFSGPHSYRLNWDLGTTELQTVYRDTYPPGHVAASVVAAFPDASIVSLVD